MYLGIDIGSGSIKVALFDGTFSVVRTSYPVGVDERTQDPTVVATTVRTACQEFFSKNRKVASSIQGLGLSGHGPSLLFIDPTGKPASPLLTWQDNRARLQADRLRRQIPGFSKDGSSYEAKLLWFYEQQPSLFSEGFTALYPKDYLIQLLCSRRVVDISTASTFAFFDRDSCTWLERKAGFPISVLPEVVDCWEAVGETGTSFSRECGFDDGILIYPGGIDAYCAVAGTDPAHSVIVEETGTSSCVSRSYPDGRGSDLHVMKGETVTVKPISSTGRSFSWLKELLGIEDLQALGSSLDPRKPEALLYLPYLIGERSPVWDERAKGAFIGLRSSTGKAELLMAVMQGTAFAIRQNIELLQLEDPVTTIRAVGGSSHDARWQQLKANITGKSYHVMRHQDAAPVGAALVAAVGNKAVPPESLAQLLPIDRIHDPDPKAFERYEELYETYCRLHETLAPTFHTLHSIQGETV